MSSPELSRAPVGITGEGDIWVRDHTLHCAIGTEVR